MFINIYLFNDALDTFLTACNVYVDIPWANKVDQYQPGLAHILEDCSLHNVYCHQWMNEQMFNDTPAWNLHWCM